MSISIFYPMIDAGGGHRRGGIHKYPVIGLYRKASKSRAFRSCGAPDQSAAAHAALRFARPCLSLVAQGDEKVLRTIIERSADPRDFIDAPAKLQAVIDYLNLRLTFDGLELRRQVLRCAWSTSARRPRLRVPGVRNSCARPRHGAHGPRSRTRKR